MFRPACNLSQWNLQTYRRALSDFLWRYSNAVTSWRSIGEIYWRGHQGPLIGIISHSARSDTRFVSAPRLCGTNKPKILVFYTSSQTTVSGFFMLVCAVRKPRAKFEASHYRMERGAFTFLIWCLYLQLQKHSAGVWFHCEASNAAPLDFKQEAESSLWLI